METTIERNARILGISIEEARQMAEDDARIDKGETLFELTGEAKAAEKKMRQADWKKSGPKPRAKKADADKCHLITMFTDVIVNDALGTELIEVINPEREISFTFNGRKFKLTLSAPRN